MFVIFAVVWLALLALTLGLAYESVKRRIRHH